MVLVIAAAGATNARRPRRAAGRVPVPNTGPTDRQTADWRADSVCRGREAQTACGENALAAVARRADRAFYNGARSVCRAGGWARQLFRLEQVQQGRSTTSSGRERQARERVRAPARALPPRASPTPAHITRAAAAARSRSPRARPIRRSFLWHQLQHGTAQLAALISSWLPVLRGLGGGSFRIHCAGVGHSRPLRDLSSSDAR